MEISTSELCHTTICFTDIIHLSLHVISLRSRRIVDPPLWFAFGGGRGGVQILDAERYIEARQYSPKKLYQICLQRLVIFDNVFMVYFLATEYVFLALMK